MVENNSNGYKAIRVKKNSKRRKAIRSSSLSDLSDELLIEILCRLDSSKSANRCKCICKHWCSLINYNSYFLCRYREIHRKERDGDEEDKLPIALLTRYYDKLNETGRNYISQLAVDYYPPINEKKLPTVKSLDFLPCGGGDTISILSTYKDFLLCSHDNCVYYICNPLTRQWAALPPRPPPPPNVFFHTIRAALFVSDEDNNGNDILKFKVVRALLEADEKMVEMEVFSSNDNSGEWRKINVPQSSYSLSNQHVSYNGMLVWSSYTTLACTKEAKRHIIGFKFHADGNVTFTYLQLPPVYLSLFKIGVWEGYLRIAHIRDCYKLEIWELNIDSPDWKLVHDLDVREFKGIAEARKSHQLRVGRGRVRAFHPHDRDILYMDLEGPSVNSYDLFYLWSCNIKKRTSQLIRGPLPRYVWPGCEVYPLHIPSWPTTL